MIAMVALALLPLSTVGWLALRHLERATIPTELARLRSHARMLISEVDQVATATAADAVAMARAPALRMVIASASAPTSPGAPGAADPREQLAALMAAQLEAKPAYVQFRLIGVADGGREVVRVDRSGPGGAIRVVPNDGLQRKGDRDYVRRAIALSPGSTSLSPIDLNQERGAIDVPHLPVLRVSTPVATVDGETYGIVVINVDMRPALARVRAGVESGVAVRVVDADGNYLLHPDPALEFGRDLGRPTRWQDDFPALSTAPGGLGAVLTEPDGERAGAVIEPSSMFPGVAIIETVPYAALAAATANVLQSSVVGAVLALLACLAVSIMVARSLGGPLAAVTRAVETYGTPQAAPIPLEASGEVGILARAFARMTADVEGYTAALEREIGERRRTEAALAAQGQKERIYQSVAESTDDAIVAMTLDGEVTAWNPAAEQLYGVPTTEAIGTRVEAMVPADRVDELRGLMDRVRRGERIERFETVRTSRSGRRIDVSLSISPVKSATGEIVGFSKIAHDISARKSAEERFQLVVEAAPSGMCVVSREGSIRLVNEAIEHLFGFDRSELLGQPIEVLIPEAVRGKHVAYRAEFAARPESRPMGAGRDLFVRRRDGTEIAVEIGLRPFGPDSGDVLCSVVDVSERRRAHQQLTEYADRLERSNQDLEEFAYVVSHDLKAPLRGISMVAEWLARDFAPVVNDDARENIALMLERTGRLSRLIAGILDYSRVSRQGITLTTVDTAALVADVIASITPPDGIAIRIAGDLPPVRYDETQLRQVFQNLIVNAVTHMGKPRGDVVVSCTPVAGGVAFGVRDQGVGIPERHRERIFGLFQTLRSKEASGNTGAGLAIVKRIVERNGGTIHVASEEGEGTEFTFTVRHTQPKTAAPAAEDVSA